MELAIHTHDVESEPWDIRYVSVEDAQRLATELSKARKEIERLTLFWDCAMSQSVGLRYNYESKVVTNERAESAEKECDRLRQRIADLEKLASGRTGIHGIL